MQGCKGIEKNQEDVVEELCPEHDILVVPRLLLIYHGCIIYLSILWDVCNRNVKLFLLSDVTVDPTEGY